MFSGIVQGYCKIIKIEEDINLRKITVDLQKLSKNLSTGASVSVNGVCLTVVSISENLIMFEIIKESLNKTNLDILKIDDKVNIERSMKLTDEIGGHQVMGHVDTTGKISSIIFTKNNCEVEIKCDKKWIKYIIQKGWIAIDGISLTVVNVFKEGFSICLIPETIKRTIFSNRKMDDIVNLEFDYSVKTIVNTIERIFPKFIKNTRNKI